MSANVIDCYLANKIANEISLNHGTKNKYSKDAKTAIVRPIFLKR